MGYKTNGGDPSVVANLADRREANAKAKAKADKEEIDKIVKGAASLLKAEQRGPNGVKSGRPSSLEVKRIQSATDWVSQYEELLSDFERGHPTRSVPFKKCLELYEFPKDNIISHFYERIKDLLVESDEVDLGGHSLSVNRLETLLDSFIKDAYIEDIYAKSAAIALALKDSNNPKADFLPFQLLRSDVKLRIVEDMFSQYINLVIEQEPTVPSLVLVPGPDNSQTGSTDTTPNPEFEGLKLVPSLPEQ